MAVLWDRSRSFVRSIRKPTRKAMLKKQFNQRSRPFFNERRLSDWHGGQEYLDGQDVSKDGFARDGGDNKKAAGTAP
jgi:hypothetical protein